MESAGTKPKVTKQSVARQQVLELIRQLGVGTAIPSERQLSVDLGVSRLTVRAALDELAREGYLVRRRGSGTYVQQPKISQQLTMTSFSEDMRRRGMTPGSRTLSLTRQLAGARLGRFLNVSPGDEIVVVKRLRLADGVSMAIETLHIPAAVVPGVKPSDLEGSFYELLRAKY
ncbi:MAG TPA: GntR family transcriptional regulator, partial [Gaiellaceae bacterium]|nr:GntR family transcriptional regulator [Gaiellaceae bacterium]